MKGFKRKRGQDWRSAFVLRSYGVPVGVKKVMPWIFPIQAGGLRLEG
jgi:hypothetical protein